MHSENEWGKSDMPIEKSEDNELLQALALDVEGTFPCLVISYEPQLRRYILSEVRDPDTVNDILQECWWDIYQALQRYSAQRIRDLKLQPWLFTIARNCVLTYFRKKNSTNTISTEDLGDTMIDRLNLSPEEILEVKQQVQLAVEAMNQLPLVSRKVLMLRFIDGLSYQEIAAQLELTVGNVRTHVSRGIRALRTKLITTNIN